MKYRYIFILIMTLVASSCANEIEPEDALQLFIPNSHNLVTKELSNKNIPYRVDEKGIIWYPSKYKKEIGHINAKVTAELSPNTSAAFNDTKSLNIAKSRFNDSKISYTLESYNNDVIIHWDEKNAVAGTIIINEIFFYNK